MLALHELATNAVKYGALSVPQGRVDLSWRVLPSPPSDTILMRWAEANGPPVSAPTRRGLGTRLLARQSGLEDVAVHFNPEGLVCEITVKAMPISPPLGPRAQRRAAYLRLPGQATGWRAAAERQDMTFPERGLLHSATRKAYVRAQRTASASRYSQSASVRLGSLLRQTKPIEALV